MKSACANIVKKSLITVLSAFVVLQTIPARSALSEDGSGKTWTHGRLFEKVITVVLENIDYDDAFNDPYFKSLIKKGVLLANYHAITHPSYPNYLALVAGSTFNIHWDRQHIINTKNITDLLEAKGLSWKSYTENYPGNCFLGSKEKEDGKYARKHVPLLSFKPIQAVSERCSKIVNAKQFQIDWKAREIPNYSFYSPNMDNDGHNTDLKTASKWLKGFLDPLLEDKEGMNKTLFMITFDESESYLGDNHVLTVLIGPQVKEGSTYSERANHYDLLRTIEENFSLGTLKNNDETANFLDGFWVTAN